MINAYQKSIQVFFEVKSEILRISSVSFGERFLRTFSMQTFLHLDHIIT